MKTKDLRKLAIVYAASFGAAALGSIFTGKEITAWYASLEKTFLTPPNWIFGPVWTLLYILMAQAAYLVWKNGKKEETKEALQLFGLQLGLNALWSILFFGGHLILTAYIEILVLLTAIILTTIWFYRINKIAGYLMIPYILWVSFASILNLLIYLANK